MHQFSHSPRSADRRRPRARRRGDLQRERTKGSPCSSRRQLASATQLQQASHKISPTWPWAVGGAGKLPPSLGRSFGAAFGGELERRAAPPRAGALHLCTGAARCWKSNALHWPCTGAAARWRFRGANGGVCAQLSVACDRTNAQIPWRGAMATAWRRHGRGKRVREGAREVPNMRPSVGHLCC